MYQSPNPTTGLRRPINDRMLAGVCSGLARTVGIDPTIVRVLWVLGSLFLGSGLLVYLIAWLLMPDDNGRRAATPLVMLIVFFIAIPAMCFLLTLPFRIFS